MATPGTAISQATGERILQLAKQHVGEKYHLGVPVPKDNPIRTGQAPGIARSSCPGWAYAANQINWRA